MSTYILLPEKTAVVSTLCSLMNLDLSFFRSSSRLVIFGLFILVVYVFMMVSCNVTGECNLLCVVFIVLSTSLDFLFVVFIFTLGIPLIGWTGRLGHLIDHETWSFVLHAAHFMGSSGVLHCGVLCASSHFKHLIGVLQFSVVWVNNAHFAHGVGIGVGGLLDSTA